MTYRFADDWFLAEWLQTLGMSQAALCRATDWDKRQASFLVNGKQRYNRDTVNAAADALKIAPFELLMHPEDAFALRRLREHAVQIAAEKRSPFAPLPDESGKRDGTHG